MSNAKDKSVLRQLGLKNILFPVFVIIAIFLGLLLGRDVKTGSDVLSIYGIPIGLFFMIYPAMVKVRINELGRSLKNFKSVGLMIGLNYLIAPFLVAGLAYAFFYLFYDMKLISLSMAQQAIVGIILLGVAPCIATVMVWTDMSKGNMSMAVSFVAWNSIIQIITTPFFIYLLARTKVSIDPSLILESIFLYLALPFFAGILTRYLLQKKSYFFKITNVLGNVQTIALLFTILVMFWSEGYGIIEYPSLIWMVAIVMLAFYFLLFNVGYLTSRKLKFNYEDSTAIGYTVAARDFEISIAIAITAFSAYPFVPIVTAIGPLLEIPLMLLLVMLQLKRKRKIETGVN
jgi:ACR3 family arsenite transporter